MNQRLVAARVEYQIPNDGGAQMIRTHHQTDNDDDVSGSSGEASSKNRQDFIHIFQHGMVGRDEIGFTTL